MTLIAPPLTDTPAINAPQPLGAILQLQPGRAHEFCGPARRMLAVWMLAATTGPVLWIRPRWNRDRLNPLGLNDWGNPERLITLNAAREPEALACAEEALRSGAVELVVAELATPPALTPLRRLHLAAETGLARRRSTSRAAGLLGLVLTPGDGGAAGVESRWRLTPCPAPDPPRHNPVQPQWRLDRLRARMAPPGCWQVSGDRPDRLCAHPLRHKGDSQHG